MQNDIAWTRISSSVSPDVSYNSQNLKINFSAPILYRYTIIDNRLEDDSQKRAGKFIFNHRYRYNTALQISWKRLHKAFYTQSPGMRTLYTGYILQNYRSIKRYDTRSFDSTDYLAR